MSVYAVWNPVVEKAMKPATPLPWNEGDVFNDICLGSSDVDFIVHACNAYPKLVAALLRHNVLIPDKETIVLLKEMGEL